jgi:hypothetical protein
MHTRAYVTGAAAAVLLLLMSLLLAIPVSAVDLTEPCSLTVSPGSDEYADELIQAGLVIDLYQVADVLPVVGADGYTFEMRSAYDELLISDEMSNAAWRALAQQAAEIALNGDMPVVSGAQPNTAITETEGGRLESGLYLIIARGADETDYISTVTDEEGTEQLVTSVHTQRYTYSFQPELVAIPEKPADASGEMNTASDGEWLYDITVSLKPERELRYGSVSIIKTLLSYNVSNGPATCVFRVEGVWDGETVFSNVYALTFTEPGQRTVVADRIPAGAEVTVTEIYSGAGYSLISEPEQTVLLEADEVAEVSFINDYDGGQKHGYGITNHFIFEPEAGWDWQQQVDSAES